MKQAIFENKNSKYIPLLLFSLFICLLLFFTLRTILNEWASYDPYQMSIAQTEELIKYINAYSAENIPPDIVPSDLNNHNCWKTLKPLIISSNNNYKISAFQNGYNPDPRASEDLTVEIKFSDANIIHLHYFHGLLIDCQDNN